MDDDSITTATDLASTAICPECRARLSRYDECYDCDVIEDLQEE